MVTAKICQNLCPSKTHHTTRLANLFLLRMGVKDLQKQFLLKEQHTSNLNSLGDGCRLGWDISGDLYRALQAIWSFEVFDCVPPVPLYNVLTTIKKQIVTAKTEYKVKLIPVFDGARHPMKDGETQDRKRKRADALKEL